MNERPNILFILSDQHRAASCGYAGETRIHTPALDRLATRAVRFDQAYCANPLCVPSRSALLLGQYSHRCGIYRNQDILAAGGRTFPRVLAEQGYRTCLIGKAHFNGDQYHGWQERPYGDLFGQAHQGDPHRDPNCVAGLGGLVENVGASGIPEPLTQTEICVAEACRWLQGHRSRHPDQPFLLGVHFDKPHFPLRAPERFLARYRGTLQAADDLEETPCVPFVARARASWPRDDEKWARALEAYFACIEWIDDALGRILAGLAYLGLADNTLIVYSSDHGELGGAHGAWNKSLFFDEATRVPLLIAHPDLQARRIDQPVSLIDLHPTFCRLACHGGDLPVDGQDLTPLLTGNTAPAIGRERVILSESLLLGDRGEHCGAMIRQDIYKFCRYRDGSEELYDLAADPRESRNLVAAPGLQTVATRMRRTLLDMWDSEDVIRHLAQTPTMPDQKHSYPWSNQFVSGDGAVYDARP